MLDVIASAIAGNVASSMLGGGGGGGGAPAMREPRPLSLSKYKRPTGRRRSGARRTVAAKSASPSVYGGGSTRYNAILKRMLRESTTAKQAKPAKA